MLRLWRDSCAFKGCVISIAILLLVVVAPWVYLDWQTKRDLEAELQRLRDEGEPLSLVEAAPEPVPASENAAELYQQALGRVTPGSGSIGPSLLESSGYGDVIEVEYVQGNVSDQTARQAFADPMVVQGMELLRQGSERDACVFPTKWEDGPAVLFPHYARMRHGARWLGARTKLEANEGNIDDALDWTRVSLRMGEHCSQDPTLIAQLVAIAIQAIGCKSAQEAMQQGPPSPEFARKMADYLRTIDMRGPFENAFRGERAMGLDCFDMVRRESASGLLSDWTGIGGTSGNEFWQALGAFYGTPLGRPLLNNDEIIYLELMDEQIEFIKTATPAQRKQRATELEQDVPRMAVLSRLLFPVFARSLDKRDQAVTNLDLYQIALLAEVFHAEHGEWPFDLQQLQDALGRELPEDPFAGGPYHYRRESDGFLVWGLGTDLDDDGGHGPYDPGYEWDNSDIIWRVARPDDDS